MRYSTGPVIANKCERSKRRWRAKEKKERLTQTSLTGLKSTPRAQSFHKPCPSSSTSNPSYLASAVESLNSESSEVGPNPTPCDTPVVALVDDNDPLPTPLPAKRRRMPHIMGIPLPLTEPESMGKRRRQIPDQHTEMDESDGVGDGIDAMNGVDDEEVNDLMNDVVQPSLVKPKLKSWEELRDGINDILDQQKKKKKVSLSLRQVSNYESLL
jgi:hypothetical protein